MFLSVHSLSSTSKPTPCWETNGDVFPKPCGNMTDSEKEIQLRGGTRSEGARTPRMHRNKSCGERNVDVLYLRAASQPKLTEKSYAQLRTTSKLGKSLVNTDDTSIKSTNNEYPLLQPSKQLQKQQQSMLKRQTLLAITDNFSSGTVAVKKGDVVTLLACKQVIDKRFAQPIQWFYVRCRNGSEGYIPAEVAGHGFL